MDLLNILNADAGPQRRVQSNSSSESSPSPKTPQSFSVTDGGHKGALASARCLAEASEQPRSHLGGVLADPWEPTRTTAMKLAKTMASHDNVLARPPLSNGTFTGGSWSASGQTVDRQALRRTLNRLTTTVPSHYPLAHMAEHPRNGQISPPDELCRPSHFSPSSLSPTSPAYSSSTRSSQSKRARLSAHSPTGPTFSADFQRSGTTSRNLSETPTKLPGVHEILHASVQRHGSRTSYQSLSSSSLSSPTTYFGEDDPATLSSIHDRSFAAAPPRPAGSRPCSSRDEVRSDDDRPGNQKCTFMAQCNLESPDRRVISHFFGRNKKETRAIPDECWVCYCRQHYQRCRYRMPPAGFVGVQMHLVRSTVVNLEKWGGVASWDIAIRKRAIDQISEEDARAALGRPIPRTCRERILLPHAGKHKSFGEVYTVINAVQEYSMHNDCEALEFEIVPQFRPGCLQPRTPVSARPKTSGSAKRSASDMSPSSSLMQESPRTPSSSFGSSISSLVDTPARLPPRLAAALPLAPVGSLSRGRSCSTDRPSTSLGLTTPTPTSRTSSLRSRVRQNTIT